MLSSVYFIAFVLQDANFNIIYLSVYRLVLSTSLSSENSYPDTA